MHITFLGTTSMFPTRERNHQSALLSQNQEHILIDCGEGTQRQLRLANIAPPKITRLLITHWHGDHTLGIPGLIENLAKSNYQKTLQIYGPKGTSLRIEQLIDAHRLKNRIHYSVHELSKESMVFETEDLQVHTIPVEHTTPCLAYTFQEPDKRKIDTTKLKKLKIPSGPILAELQAGKDIVYQGKKLKVKELTFIKPGKKLAFMTDTRVCPACMVVAKDADLLICEATFGSELQEQATEYAHMTAAQAATIAKKAKCKKLILTHFSQRYKDVAPLVKEAQAIFPATDAAEDFMTVTL